MKKIFSLFAALTLCAGLWAQTAGTTILVHNLTGWDNLYLYMWGDGGNDLGGGWPGFKAQREDEGDPIFLVAEGEYDGKSESLIFNNGNGAQLADYPITLGDSYELWVTLDGVFDEEPAPEYKYTEYANWQIKYGNSWDWSDNMEKVEDGLFKLEILWEGTGINVKSDENPIKKDWFALEELTIGEEVIAPTFVDVYLKVVDDETVAIGLGVEPTTALPTLPYEGKVGKEAAKFLYNGQLIIRKDGKTYNAMGAEVTK